MIFTDFFKLFLLQHHGTTQDELIKHFEKAQASQMMTAQGPISCVRAFYILLLDSDSLVQFCAGSG